MKSTGADFRFISYPGALHSFTSPDADELGKKYKMDIAYHAEADKKSWEELKKFLNQIF
jgi:dienelactone hydrolase